MSTIITTLAESSEVVEYKFILEESLSSQEEFAAITQDFADALQKPDVEEQAANDIRNLTRNINEIEEAFAHVSPTFIAFDSAGFRDRENNVLQLGWRWREYFDKFKSIRQRSRYNALAASEFMKYYSQAILTDVDESSFAQLRAELQVFVKKLDEKAEEALKNQNDFSALATDLRQFGSVIEDTIRKAGGPPSAHLMDAFARLSVLQDHIVGVAQRTSTMGVVYASALPVGSVSSGIAFAFLSPNAMSLVVEELVNKYRHSLDTTRQEIEGLGVAGKIDVISRIWQCLKSDMLLLEHQLALSVDPDMPITKFFLKKISATRGLYLKLATLLEMYAQGAGSN